MLVLSWPSSYLNDKRTAFGQGLSLTLGFPALPAEVAGSEVRAYLEIMTNVSVDHLLTLEFEVNLDATLSGPQEVQVGVVVGVVVGEVVGVVLPVHYVYKLNWFDGLP